MVNGLVTTRACLLNMSTTPPHPGIFALIVICLLALLPWFQRNSPLSVEIARVIEIGVRDSQALDTEALCILGGEKVCILGFDTIFALILALQKYCCKGSGDVLVVASERFYLVTCMGVFLPTGTSVF